MNPLPDQGGGHGLPWQQQLQQLLPLQQQQGTQTTDGNPRPLRPAGSPWQQQQQQQQLLLLQEQQRQQQEQQQGTHTTVGNPHLLRPAGSPWQQQQQQQVLLQEQQQQQQVLLQEQQQQQQEQQGTQTTVGKPRPLPPALNVGAPPQQQVTVAPPPRTQPRTLDMRSHVKHHDIWAECQAMPFGFSEYPSNATESWRKKLDHIVQELLNADPADLNYEGCMLALNQGREAMVDGKFEPLSSAVNQVIDQARAEAQVSRDEIPKPRLQNLLKVIDVHYSEKVDSEGAIRKVHLVEYLCFLLETCVYGDADARKEKVVAFVSFLHLYVFRASLVTNERWQKLIKDLNIKNHLISIATMVDPRKRPITRVIDGMARGQQIELSDDDKGKDFFLKVASMTITSHLLTRFGLDEFHVSNIHKSDTVNRLHNQWKKAMSLPSHFQRLTRRQATNMPHPRTQSVEECLKKILDVSRHSEEILMIDDIISNPSTQEWSAEYRFRLDEVIGDMTNMSPSLKLATLCNRLVECAIMDDDCRNRCVNILVGLCGSVLEEYGEVLGREMNAFTIAFDQFITTSRIETIVAMAQGSTLNSIKAWAQENRSSSVGHFAGFFCLLVQTMEEKSQAFKLSEIQARNLALLCYGSLHHAFYTLESDNARFQVFNEITASKAELTNNGFGFASAEGGMTFTDKAFKCFLQNLTVDVGDRTALNDIFQLGSVIDAPLGKDQKALVGTPSLAEGNDGDPSPFEELVEVTDLISNGAFGHCFRGNLKGYPACQVALRLQSYSVVELRSLQRALVNGTPQHIPGVIKTLTYFEVPSVKLQGKPICVGQMLEYGTTSLRSYAEDVDKKRATMNPHELIAIAVGVIYDLAKTVDQLNCFGFVHRGLKPENTVLTCNYSSDGKMVSTWKIIDNEMMPAQGDLQRNRDVFALGAILFRLMTQSEREYWIEYGDGTYINTEKNDLEYSGNISFRQILQEYFFYFRACLENHFANRQAGNVLAEFQNAFTQVYQEQEIRQQQKPEEVYTPDFGDCSFALHFTGTFKARSEKSQLVKKITHVAYACSRMLSGKWDCRQTFFGASVLKSTLNGSLPLHLSSGKFSVDVLTQRKKELEKLGRQGVGGARGVLQTISEGSHSTANPAAPSSGNGHRKFKSTAFSHGAASSTQITSGDTLADHGERGLKRRRAV